jgi:hypothetical protein
MAFLLRIALPDRPGALGSVASALGAVGGDIVNLDVVERSADRAVDDLVIDFPHGGLADVLITAAASVEGVYVESIRPYAAVLDPYRELELLDSLVAAPDDAATLLCEGVVRVFRAGWSLILGPAEPGADGVPVTATSTAAPQVDRLDVPWPNDKAAAFDELPLWAPHSWHTVGTELAWCPVGRRALMAGRPAMRWLPAEVARLAHLCGIAGDVLERGR